MNVIVGLSNLMEHELDNPQKMREYIQKIQTSSNHLLGLINDVLDMSKIESGENRMNIETFDLTEQIREIDMLIYAKYRFVITDNGIGMKKEYLEHIFEPFSRQENSVTNRVQGTGLRMAITKNIVDMMSGIIQVEGEEKEPLPDKEADQMAWVRVANQHRTIAEEIILKELIYV